MKNRFLLALSFFGLLSITVSCDNDFSVSDDWSDVTVVYSLLDPVADTNWVRIERGYLGDAAASQSYGIPDSLYYDSLVVILNEYNSSNELVKTITLDRDNTSRDRQPGVFTTNDYRLYRTTEKINEESIYEIIVKQTNSKFTDVKARTEIVGGQIPGDFNDFGFLTPRDVPTAQQAFFGKVEVEPSDRAKIYQVFFTFNYKEYDIITKEEVMKSIYFKFATLRGEATNSSAIAFNGTIHTFNSLVADQIPVDANKLRFIENMEIDVYAGGSDLDKYMTLNAPTTGVNQTKPEFPQIEEGTGLFSSRTVISLNDVDFPRADRGQGPYLTDYNSFFLSPILCDRNFVKLLNQDTLVCTIDPINGRVAKHYK
tara:strand:+ start:1299 stop:2408 length:1110 start_codon:yes stop_codon:yes gene_type:complete